jgi:UDP-N-acetylmuramoyl-tripeptide--D-alanyl-D-alanine ligase
MIHLTLEEIAKIVGGELHGDPNLIVVGSVETDSRKISAGGLFIAKPGEVTDGHLFINSALQAGAVGAVVEHLVDEQISQVVVKDSVIALGVLAEYVVAEVKSKGKLVVIGVTGSNGKTTTKNMLRTVLSEFGNTIAPEESFNNEVGAPYSMLKVDEQTDYLVVELGADGLGSIGYLAKMCQPDIAIELKVGLAHAGEFGGIEITERIKAELVEALSDKDIALLNADDPRVINMASKTKAKIKTFAIDSAADYRATEVKPTIAGTSFTLTRSDATSEVVTLQILGQHHVYNALASLAVADVLGLDSRKSIKALESMSLAERWRMELTTRKDGLVIINDAYNSSPDSLKAALVTLADLGRQTGKPTVAVIGEMAELGEFSVAEHDAIGRLVVRLNIDQLVVVGEGAKLVHMGASQEGSWDGESKYFDEISQALVYLRGMLTSNEIVLVKSSKSAKLRHLGDDLLEVNE